MPGATPTPSPLQIIREELPRFLNEPHAQDMREFAHALVPQSVSELAFDVVLAPVARPARLTAGALSALTASDDAEGAVFPRIGGGLLKFISDNYPEATRAVRRALGQSHKTGNEWAVAHHPEAERVWSSGQPNLVSVPPNVRRLLQRPSQDPQDAFLMHTHPFGDVSPSIEDLTFNPGRPGLTEIIGAADRGSPYVAFRRKRPFSGQDYDSYVDQAAHHFQSPEVEDLLMGREMIDPDLMDTGSLADEIARLTYMRNLGMQDKLDMYYNDLRRVETEPGISVPMADIAEMYWNRYHR